ncbi:hypothetical protein P154DRAFT_568835 [Amniculicola lignicola CBS 123094]|uniref:Uncharacterized protein n=1 Tax=Amniculicola lignicola CBS 123094 TaxID=1392246 RepID=A0A6A5X500_9PLEO|nr:hypothetical protein P154DRAFT_568835 [Amniculicola lignicola CBS 123094]
MSRPKSMTDFAQLLEVSKPTFPRKKPSVSLAAGLIMATESPRQHPSSPQLMHGKSEGTRDNLFYAYAQKDDYAHSPPYILTFASAAVANQWWALVQREYSESTREGAQLFILKGEDMQQQIQDNPRFYDLRNKWFYTASDGTGAVIPLQDYSGNPISSTPAPSRPTSRQASSATIPEESAEDKKEDKFDMAALAETLSQMNAMISENSAQIRALSVAQSEGLQRMQEINESNSTQIKALTDGQERLQSMLAQNASHYIALANNSFGTQDHVKSILETNAQQISALADGQQKLASTCTSMMKSMQDLGDTISHSHSLLDSGPQFPPPPRSESGPSEFGSIAFSQIGNRISPPPRKLNRRVKGVWYEYDTPAGSATSVASSKPNSIAARGQTPPATPKSTKSARS